MSVLVSWFRTLCPIHVLSSGQNVLLRLEKMCIAGGIDKKKILLEVWTGPDKNVAWGSGVDWGTMPSRHLGTGS